MSRMDDRLTEILGDASPDASGFALNPFALQRRALQLRQQQQQYEQQTPFQPRRHHRHHHHRRDGQQQYGQQPGAPGAPGAPAAAAPAGQPYQGAMPIPPGNWGGGAYPPPGWSPGQPLPGYPQGWPPPGSPWPGTFTPGVSAVPAPVGVLTSYDPYGNPVFAQPEQQYASPQPTIDVTVGEALAGGVRLSTIVGCLRRAGYSQREISGAIERCCGW